MANRSTEIGRILRAGDVALARTRIRRALFRARGDTTAAGRILGVCRFTIWRWIYRLALEDALAEARRLAAERRASTRVDARKTA